MDYMKRRDFITNTIGACIVLNIPASLKAAVSGMKKKVSIGIIADLHHDIMHDGLERLTSFTEAMQKLQPAAILQMGDFAYPGDTNKEIIDLFNTAHPAHLHVIGNHDTDAGYTKEQCISYWGMPARYYAQEINGIWFIVLDGNDKGSPDYKGGYPSFIGRKQIDWLKQTLTEINGPIVIVSHQPLAGAMAIDNAGDVQEVLTKASGKILIVINGHTHIDAMVTVRNIHYVHINSSSYFWVGGEFKHNSYSAEIHESHPWISSTCPYKDALFSTLIIDPHAATITITSKKTEWVGKSPKELGFKDKPLFKNDEEIVPCIREHKFKTPITHKL